MHPTYAAASGNLPAETGRTPAGVRATVGRILTECRDFLDARGRLAWIAAMVLGFVACWPLGLAILGYMIWSKRMFGNCHHRAGRNFRSDRMGGFGPASTGNTAFDAYRAETLKRLEDEHQAFLEYLAKLREAKDKAEFDRFMDERGQA